MSNLELTLFLEELADMGFLDSILAIQEKNNKYKQSDFYKTTKISLSKLYEMFMKNYFIKYAIKNQIESFLYELDNETISNKLEDILLGFIEGTKIKEYLEKVIEQFNFEDLKKQSEELEKTIQTLK